MTRNRGARHRRPTNRARAKRLHRKAAQLRRGNLARRVRAAGLGRRDDTEERSIDDYRIALARRILMLMNRTRGCRWRICKRNRGCMAPGGICGGEPEERAQGVVIDENYLRLVASIRQGLKDADARREAEDKARALPAPFVPTKAGKRR